MAHILRSKHATMNPQLVEELIFDATLITVTTFYNLKGLYCLVAN